MKTNLVKIGNSKGVRIPKAIRDQLGLTAEIEMTVRGRELVLTPAGHPRAGWEEAAREIVAAGEDENPWDGVASTTTFDDEEWTW